MALNKKYDIFISYRRNNMTLVGELVQRLKNYYDVFWDQRLGSGYWDIQLEKAIENSKVVVINFNENSLKKKEEGEDWFYREIVHSMNKKSQEQIIPVCYDGFEIPKDLELPGLTDIEKEKLEILRDRHQRIMEKTLDEIVKKIVEYMECLGIKAKESVKENTQECFLKFREIVPLCSFKGRKEEISKAVKLIEENEVVFLSGMGGIGKTELARRITEEMTGEYRCIFCKYDSDLKSTLAKIDVKGIDEDNFARKGPVLKNLLDEKVLLVIDNFDFDGDNIDDYIDEFCRYSCKKLITTRNTFENIQFDCKASIMKVDKLQNDELRELFEETYGETVSDEQAKKILDYTGGLTLAVPILASLCVSSAMTVDELLVKISQGLASLEDSETIKYNKDGNGTGTVPQIIRVLFKLDKIDAQKKKTLCNLSLLQFLNVTRKTYRDFALFNSKGNLDAFNALAETNWIKKTEGETPLKTSFELHPIINELVKTDLMPSIETSPEVFEAVQEKISEHIRNGIFPVKFLWSFAGTLNLKAEPNYKYITNLLKIGSLTFPPGVLPEPKKRIKRELEEILYSRKIFSDADANLVSALIHLPESSDDRHSIKNLLVSCFDWSERDCVSKESIAFIIEKIRELALTYTDNKKRTRYYDWLVMLEKNYSDFFADDFFEVFEKELISRKEKAWKTAQEDENITKLKMEIGKANTFQEAYKIALKSGSEAFGKVIKKVFVCFMDENSEKEEILKIYNTVINENFSGVKKEKLYKEFFDAYIMCEKPFLTYRESLVIAEKLFDGNDGAVKITAAFMCMEQEQIKSVINEIIYSKPIGEKTLAELEEEYDCFYESMLKYFPWFEFGMDKAEVLFEYIGKIEKEFGKDEAYYRFVCSWYRFLSYSYFDDDVRIKAAQKVQECENTIMGFSLKQTDEN